MVIGGSAGGLDAMRGLVARLPAGLAASLFVVWHQSPGWKSALPELLTRAGPLPAAYATDGQRIEQGRIYVAPNDHHLLLEPGYMRLTKGPKENRFRPALDPLFRSAAYVYGARVVGVVLSGGLDDGTAGLYTVKLRGGTAIVQDPADATVDAMPRNALEYTEADYQLPAAAIGELLGRLAREAAADAPPLSPGEDDRTRSEIRIAAGGNAMREDLAQFGDVSPFTCPECRGALTRVTDGRVVRYRCHTGHALSRETLLSSITEKIEDSLYDAVRALDETVMLLKEMAVELARQGDTGAAEKLLARAREAEQRSQPVRRAARDEREPQ